MDAGSQMFEKELGQKQSDLLNVVCKNDPSLASETFLHLELTELKDWNKAIKNIW